MNRCVMITGSTRGIGYSTAAEFLKHGDRVAILCRHKRHVEAAIKHLSVSSAKENVLGLVGDVRKEQDVKRIVGECLKRFGSIDVLINNAGVAAYKPVEETTEDEWDRIMETNLKGTFLFLRHVIPVMKRQGSGIIINISSALGVEAEANFSAYCASKFGVVGLTGSVADELSDDGIRIYAILPWAVDTGLLAGSELEIPAYEMLTPEYVARKIYEAAQGSKKSGALIKVYP